MDLIIDRVHEHSTSIAPTQPRRRYKDATTALLSSSHYHSPPFSTIPKPKTIRYLPSLNILPKRTRPQTNIDSTTQPIHTLQVIDKNPTNRTSNTMGLPWSHWNSVPLPESRPQTDPLDSATFYHPAMLKRVVKVSLPLIVQHNIFANRRCCKADMSRHG